MNNLSFGENKFETKLSFAKARKQLFYLLCNDYGCVFHLVEEVIGIILKSAYLTSISSQIYMKAVCKFVTPSK